MDLLTTGEKLRSFKSSSQYLYNLWGKILFDNQFNVEWLVNTSEQQAVVLGFLVCVENAFVIWNAIDYYDAFL